MTETPTAVAWSLLSPSASGGKRYAILLFDRYVLVGWGSVSGTAQYKMQVCATATEARAYAVAQTASKEASGYTMRKWPTQSHLPADKWKGNLPQWAEHRGASTVLDGFFKTIFRSGSLLSS